MEKPQLDATSAAVDTFSPIQLRRLLVVASGADTPAADLEADDIGALLDEPCRRHGESSPALVDTVIAPGTPVAELRRIKDLAKRMLDGASNDAEGEAARLLYHLAVAAAVGHHGVDISTRPTGKRRLMYERLALAFAGHAAAGVFSLAAARITSDLVPVRRNRVSSVV